MKPINLLEYQSAARKKLPAMTYDYYAGGALDELTLQENNKAYQRLQLAPRVLVDVSKRETNTAVLGNPIDLPVIIAPMAFQQMAHPDGEVATAQAAQTAGTIMTLSTMSNAPMEDVARASNKPVWFQLYVYKDRHVTRGLVDRAQDAGCKALVLTVDAPLLGRREQDIRNLFHLPKNMQMSNLAPAGLQELAPVNDDSSLASYIAEQLDPSLNWNDLDWLRSITKIPVLVKGIQRADDARRARDHGADAIIISNHGGRQLDTARPTIDILPEVAQTIAGAIEIYIDGGIRRGSDILKAIALGAHATLLGRPILWGLAVDGARGAAHVLQLLKDELRLAMGLCGANSIKDITEDLVANKPSRP